MRWGIFRSAAGETGEITQSGILIDSRPLTGIADGPRVRYVDKLSSAKGAPVLLAALDRIRAAAPRTRFAFAGRGVGDRDAAGDLVLVGSSTPTSNP
jgi:hypothetical protein